MSGSPLRVHCSTSHPRGNPVDGLPRVLRTGAVSASSKNLGSATIGNFRRKCCNLLKFKRVCGRKSLKCRFYALNADQM